MHAVSFDNPGPRDTLRGRRGGEMVRCIATRAGMVVGAGAGIRAVRGVPGAMQACRATLEYSVRNGLLAGDFHRSGGSPTMSTHDAFFHWANCFGPGPPGR
jgi:hypothetical protein